MNQSKSKSTPLSANAAPSRLRSSTLLLAAAVALEAIGLGALTPALAAPAVVAAIDGADMPDAATIARPPQAATLHAHVLAQATIPAR